MGGKALSFQLLFKSFVIELLLHCAKIKSAAQMLRLDWHALNQIMKRGVERWLIRRENEEIAYLGID